MVFLKERKKISIVKLLGEGELEPSPHNTLDVPSISYWVVLFLEDCVFRHCCFSPMVLSLPLGSAASTSLENLLEMYILRPLPKLLIYFRERVQMMFVIYFAVHPKYK